MQPSPSLSAHGKSSRFELTQSCSGDVVVAVAASVVVEATAAAATVVLSARAVDQIEIAKQLDARTKFLFPAITPEDANAVQPVVPPFSTQHFVPEKLAQNSPQASSVGSAKKVLPSISDLSPQIVFAANSSQTITPMFLNSGTSSSKKKSGT